MLEQQLREVEITLSEANSKIKLGEAVNRLRTNPDFTLVFLDNYFKSHVLNLADLQSHVESIGSAAALEKSKAVSKEMISVGLCKQYLDEILRQADEAKITKEEMEEEMKQDQVQPMGV